MSAAIPRGGVDPGPHRRRVRRRRAKSALRYAVVLIALLFFLFPIYWIAITAVKLPQEFLSNPPTWWPSAPTRVHYELVMKRSGYTALRNSFEIAGLATLFATLIGMFAAYALARFNTGGKHLGFWLLSQRMMPPVVLVIPIFLIFRNLKWLDTHHGLIILYTAFQLPYVVWMLRSYIAGVPHELEESALVDGLGIWGVVLRITLPLILPGLIATSTFAFIFSWTEFLFAVVLTRTNAYTLPVTISGYIGSQGTAYGQAASLAVVATAPLFAIGLLVQRHFVRGLTLGAVRG